MQDSNLDFLHSKATATLVKGCLNQIEMKVEELAPNSAQRDMKEAGLLYEPSSTFAPDLHGQVAPNENEKMVEEDILALLEDVDDPFDEVTEVIQQDDQTAPECLH